MSFTKNERLIVGILLACAALAGGYIAFKATIAHGATGSGDQASACTTYTTSAIAVGNQVATTILPSHANRAFAIIEQPANATNTVSIALASTSASVGTGVQLSPATTTSPVPMFTFGLATDKPYVGPVSVITSTGSTTVQVTDCLY